MLQCPVTQKVPVRVVTVSCPCSLAAVFARKPSSPPLNTNMKMLNVSGSLPGKTLLLTGLLKSCKSWREMSHQDSLTTDSLLEMGYSGVQRQAGVLLCALVLDNSCHKNYHFSLPRSWQHRWEAAGVCNGHRLWQYHGTLQELDI